MASTRRMRGLESELDGLVAAGVLDAAEAARVRAHYARAAAARPAVPLFAVLGAALIGLGVILLLAHNWEALPRSARAAISLGWLLAGQGTAAWALWRRPGSTAWTEAGALFASFSLAGCLALLSQTYQIPGDLGSFVVTWAWLSLPVAYALDARAAIALAIALAGARLVSDFFDEERVWPAWALLAATGPYLVSLARRTRVSARDGLVAWVAAPVLVMVSLLQPNLGSVAAVLGLGLVVAAGLVAIGAGDPPRPALFAASAARFVGGATIAVGVLALSHAEVWDGVGSDAGEWRGLGPALLPLALGVAALAAAGWRAASWWRARDGSRLLLVAAPVAYVLAWILGVATGAEGVAAWGMALYALALGSATVLAGVAEGAVSRANAGMLLLGGAIAMRFVDSDWSFTVRGLVFIGLGIAFLVLNLRLRGRRGEPAP